MASENAAPKETPLGCYTIDKIEPKRLKSIILLRSVLMENPGF